MTKPRVRDKAGHEVNLSSYERFPSPPRREASICKKLIHGVSLTQTGTLNPAFGGTYMDWVHEDSNLGPRRYQRRALAN